MKIVSEIVLLAFFLIYVLPHLFTNLGTFGARTHPRLNSEGLWKQLLGCSNLMEQERVNLFVVAFYMFFKTCHMRPPMRINNNCLLLGMVSPHGTNLRPVVVSLFGGGPFAFLCWDHVLEFCSLKHLPHHFWQIITHHFMW